LRVVIEVAADGQIQNHEELLIEHPIAVLLHRGARHEKVSDVVDKEADAQRVPFDGVQMEVGDPSDAK